MIPTYTYSAITRVPGHTSTVIAAIIVAAIRVFVTSIGQTFAFVDVYLKAMQNETILNRISYYTSQHSAMFTVRCVLFLLYSKDSLVGPLDPLDTFKMPKLNRY